MKKTSTLALLALLTWGCLAHSEEAPSGQEIASPASDAALAPIELAPTPTIKRTVEVLASEIGERNVPHYPQLEQARNYLSRRLEAAGYEVELNTFEESSSGKAVHNLIAGKAGSEEIIVVGAHYDSTTLTPGANDNGSGVAVLLHLAEKLKEVKTERTVRFVLFVNEEPPYFMTKDMGSQVYAKMRADRGDKIVGMLSLETMGFYSDEAGSQHFPPGLSGYPDRGNFLAFVAEPNSEQFLLECLDSFEGLAVESLVGPATLEGVSWSDHASFWRHGYPGVMVTDTAPFRYPHYHRTTDTPDKIDYAKLKRAAEGLESVITAVAGIKDEI